MDNKIGIEQIRKAMVNAKSDSERVIEFMKLVKHASLTWEDLLLALQYEVIIAEQAAFRLHDFTGVKIPPEGPIRDKHAWEQILESNDIDIRVAITRDV
jgi:hypothetical protein